MRFISRAALAAALCALPVFGFAAKLDLSKPDDANLALRKIQCSAKDNVPVTYFWHGEAFSRVPGEADRKLFRVQGMNTRQCVTVNDAQRGKGWRLVSREILLYLDPKTGEVLKTWQNPWTGKAVDVVQTINDPVNQPPVFATGRDGTPMRWPGDAIGNNWWMTSTIPLFYPNPLAGDYQQYIGGTYHATEMFNFMGDVDDLLDDRRDSAKVRVGWVRVSGWLPWMQMGDRAGILYFHTAGRKLDKFEDIEEPLKGEIATNYPDFRAPPPGDDPRPNETSWTYFKKKVPVTPARREAR